MVVSGSGIRSGVRVGHTVVAGFGGIRRWIGIGIVDVVGGLVLEGPSATTLLLAIFFFAFGDQVSETTDLGGPVESESLTNLSGFRRKCG